jgi:hypothetical protein
MVIVIMAGLTEIELVTDCSSIGYHIKTSAASTGKGRILPLLIADKAIMMWLL